MVNKHNVQTFDPFFNGEICEHEWAGAFCMSEDFTKIIQNGEECEKCGEKRGNQF